MDASHSKVSKKFLSRSSEVNEGQEVHKVQKRSNFRHICIITNYKSEWRRESDIWLRVIMVLDRFGEVELRFRSLTAEKSGF